MKEKILELIHKELENIGDKNIFYNKNNTTENLYLANPIKNKNEYKYRVCLPYDWKHKELKYETCECLQYILIFEDGNPPIEVNSVIKTEYSSEDITKKFLWFFNRKIKETAYYYTNTVEVAIQCGKYHFTLTEDEKNDLIERTKFAYQRYKFEEDKQYEDEINKKLDLRLKKWEKRKK